MVIIKIWSTLVPTQPVNIKQGQQQDRLTTCRCLWWRRHHGYWWDQRIFPGQWKNRGSRRYVSQLSAAQGTDNKRMKTWKFSDNLDLITATLEAWYWIGDSMAICWRVIDVWIKAVDLASTLIVKYFFVFLSKLFPICPTWFVFKVIFLFPLAFGKEGLRRKAEEGGSELWAGAQPLSHFPFQPRPALCQPAFQAPFFLTSFLRSPFNSPRNVVCVLQHNHCQHVRHLEQTTHTHCLFKRCAMHAGFILFNQAGPVCVV